MPGRIISAVCLFTTLLGLALPSQALDVQPGCPIGAISASGYLFEDGAGAVDLDTPVTGPGGNGDPVPHGESVYYPLLNGTVSGLLYEQASATFEAARTAVEAAAEALETASQQLDEAERAACGGTDVDGWCDALFSDPDYLAALDHYNAVKSDYDEARAAYRRTQGNGEDLWQTDSDPYVRGDKAVDRIRISAEWSEGADCIESLSVVKRPARRGGRQDSSLYFLAITIGERGNQPGIITPVMGTISLRIEASPADDFAEETVTVGISLQVGLDEQAPGALIPVSPAPTALSAKDGEATLLGFEADQNSFFLADADTRRSVALGFNCEEDPGISAAYPDADLLFCNGNGASFREPGYLFLSAGRRRWLYAIEPDGSLLPLHCSYNGEKDVFLIRTRILGRYLLSDTPLPASVPEDSTTVAAICDNATGINYHPASGEYALGDGSWSTTRPKVLGDAASIRDVLADNGLTVETALQTSPSSANSSSTSETGLERRLLLPAAAAAAAAVAGWLVLRRRKRHAA
ncbi:MAG: hypothetical protein DBX44_02995 [Oscillospiraceae bacterium]|nr:MAG: hypothetical protein DBX44_02995 [Oscillospiraceae bacterium]